MELFKIFGSILIDNKDAIKELDLTRQEAYKLQQGLNKASDLGKKAMKILGASILAIGTSAFVASADVDKAFKGIIKSTGVTGKEAEELRDTFLNVYKGVPASTDQVSKALANLSKVTGATGKELEDLTFLTMTYARVNDEDAGESAKTLGRLMNALDKDVKGLPKTMDQLTKASQLSGIGVNQLAEYIIDAGPAFEEMGFDLERSIGLFASFEKAGANPREVLSSLNIVMNRLAKEGATDAEEAFNTLLEQIKDAPDILSATTIASEAFGARVGSKVADDIRAGRFEVDDWVKALQDAEGTLEKTGEESLTFGDKLTVMKNKGVTALLPLGDELLNVAEKIFEYLEPAMDKLADVMVWVADKADILIPILAGVLGGIVAFKVISGIATLFTVLTTVMGAVSTAGGIMNAVMLANPFGIIAVAIGAVIGAGILLVKNWDKVVSATKGAFDKIKSFLNFKWAFPKIKLPKFQIKGSANPLKWLTEGIPKISVVWNKLGGIMTQPTIFGGVGDTAFGGGEAGHEAILPLTENVLGDIGKGIASTMQDKDFDINDLVLALMRAFNGMRFELADGGNVLRTIVDDRLIEVM